MIPQEWDLLLDRYLAGECSPAEEAIVEQEFEARGGSRTVLEALRSARALRAGAEEMPLSHTAPPAELAAAFTRLDQRLVEAGLRPTPRRRLRLEPARDRSPRHRSIPWYGLRAAAVTTLLLGGAALAAWLLHRPRAQSAIAVSLVGGQDFATARGQRATFRLPDGTQVVLNVDSHLRVPAAYGRERRDVYVEGEAYLTVVHDAARPFTVHTARGVTRDIGTKFDIRAYPDDATESVVVTEGVVAVAAKTNVASEQQLKAGQLAVVLPTGTVAIAERVDVDRELAWTRGELHLENIPLGVAIRRLGQWYDVDVVLADSSLGARPVSGVYADEPIDQVLTLVTAAVGARFERHGKRVVIFTKTGGAQP